MVRTKIMKAPPTDSGHFYPTTRNTDLSQRATLEEVIVNLASSIGIKKIYKQQSARGAIFYEVQANGSSGYQSASNTILDLSRRLARIKDG